MSKPIKVPADYPVQPLKPGEPAIRLTTCGVCGARWDDGKVTSLTPVPSGRCPFEALHRNGETLKLRGPNGLVVELDRNEIYPSDPGQGTPAMVYYNKGMCDEDSGTYACALGEGELSYHGRLLDTEQMKWLQTIEDEVNDFLFPKE